MKANYFNNYVYKNVNQLIDRLDIAIMVVINSPNQTKVITNISRDYPAYSLPIHQLAIFPVPTA